MFLPTPTEHGGSPVGNSYLSDWVRCKRRWFYRHYWPHYGADGEVVARGLTPADTAPALLGGSLFHVAKAAYWESGIRDGEDTGEYQLDAGITAAEGCAADRADEFKNDDDKRDALAKTRALLTNYHNYFGPGGYRPLYPEIKMVCDTEGRPMIEREFWVPLGYEDYVVTSRIDTVVLFQDKYLRVSEHKTSAPGMWVNKLLGGLAKSSQYTTEAFVLANCYPDHPVADVEVNAHIKGWSKPTPASPLPMKSATTSRTPAQLERFRKRAVSILSEIGSATDMFDALLSHDTPFDAVVDQLFPETGEHTDTCFAYNRDCDYMGPCRVGHHSGTLGGYKPARRLDEPMEDLS